MVELKKKVTLKTKATDGAQNAQQSKDTKLEHTTPQVQDSTAPENVQLKRKQPSVVISPSEKPSQSLNASINNERTNDSNDNNGDKAQSMPSGSSKKWVIFVVIVLVLAGLIYYFTQRGNNDNPISQQDSSIAADSLSEEQPTDAASRADTTISASGKSDTGDISTASGSENRRMEEGTTSVVNKASNLPNSSKNATSGVDASFTANGSIEDLARQVIRGNFGNGEERKQKLGSNYAAIQKRVNEMYKEGLVK